MNLLLISFLVSIIVFILLLIIEKTYTIKDLIIAFFLCAIPFLNAFCLLFIFFKYSQENEYLIEKRQQTANFINSILNYKLK